DIFVIGEGIDGCKPLARREVLWPSAPYIWPLRLVHSLGGPFGREQNLA
ncbi:MAG: hypothetical protein JWQ22_2508, partial [Devosia sp.]|nr:hypothetical protein [Devosia sp.]